MNVIDVMTASPLTIRPHQPLSDALALMTQHHIKHLPVVSGSKHVVGIVTDRDCRQAVNSPFVVRERWQDEALLAHVQIRSVMTSAPIVVSPSASAVEAARLMLTHRIGCLPVLREETLIGIVTRSDILIAFITVQERTDVWQNNHNSHKP